MCPLCRKMRKLYKSAEIKKLTVLYSPEELEGELAKDGNSVVPGSTSFTPPAVGMMLAGKVLLYLSKEDNAEL
ncbi:MAG: tRNA threonylcarbamoyladenosine dehydratase, partial [Eubacteriales bacterium]|nr:tRNA threonylcarbamoyladenosine dehydratase [Eubacteriales bacterium]